MVKRYVDQLEDELRALWRHVPLSASAVEAIAPNLAMSIGAPSDDGRLVDNLSGIVTGNSRDIAALRAVLFENTDLSVDQRLAAFGTTYWKDARTVRRWAEQGARRVAQMVGSEFTRSANVFVEVHGTPESFWVRGSTPRSRDSSWDLPDEFEYDVNEFVPYFSVMGAGGRYYLEVTEVNRDPTFFAVNDLSVTSEEVEFVDIRWLGSLAIHLTNTTDGPEVTTTTSAHSLGIEIVRSKNSRSVT